MHGLIVGLARVLAVLGGVVLTLLVLMTCLSVLGRGGNTFGHSALLNDVSPALAKSLIGTGIRPITGDYELVEAGIAFSVFAFLPLCQLRQGHASVDVFTSFLSERINRAILAFWEVIFALVLILISWRLSAGMISKLDNGETTFLLQFPIWWAYAASFAASVVAALTGVYTATVRVLASLTGREVRLLAGEVGH